MTGFDMDFALTIAIGGLGAVFLILIVLSFAIGITRRFSEWIDRTQASGNSK
jgi:Na+-transporting methylmalonyl-CoA/oxaloacetate decarboxylase gamma subunit